MNADQLKTRMAQLPLPITDKIPPYWEAWRLDLYNWILDNNPAEFGKCPAIYHTMLVNHWPGPIQHEYAFLPGRLDEVCTIPHFGPNDPFKQDNRLSMNLIHQAYHIYQWENATGRKINTLDTIVEFGGGYGAMCLLVHRLGFEGKYIIYDLPEFSLLQEYYLSQFGLLANVEWNPKSLKKTLDGNSYPDLYMALYSLSEVSPENRTTGETHFYAKSYLFLYSGQWEQWDNVDWFQRRWPKLASSDLSKSPVENWKHTELTHLPSPENYYSIGW